MSKAYFDWNEVRVSTVKELGEVMKALPNPQASANLLRRCLQATFEANYTFDLESMKKLNLGVAVQKLSAYDGMSPFVVSYVTQTSLGGHSIPLDAGAMGSLAVLGLVEEGASAKDGCSGMERAIPKNKGLEFGSLAALAFRRLHRESVLDEPAQDPARSGRRREGPPAETRREAAGKASREETRSSSPSRTGQGRKAGRQGGSGREGQNRRQGEAG
ncbi:MAG: hypothetical protein QM775_12390 [Pirellulales bacterium]